MSQVRQAARLRYCGQALRSYLSAVSGTQATGRLVFYSCAVLLLVLFLPSLLYGLDGNLRLLLGWVKSTFGTTIPNLTSQDSVSILGMYSKWLGIGSGALALSMVTIAVLVTVFVVVFWKRADRAFPEYLEISLLLTLIPLFSPSGWDYTLLLSTPAIICLINYFRDLSAASKLVTGTALLAIGLSLYDVLGVCRAYLI